MRWSAKKIPKVGDRITVKYFALFPKRIKDTWIWLEMYRSRQELETEFYPGIPAKDIWKEYKRELIDD